MQQPAKDYPMPSGVEAMSKQELWNWFQRSTLAAQEQSDIRRWHFTTYTGLHPTAYKMNMDPYQIIEEQRKRMKGLELQMAQMQKGYKKKFKKLKHQQGEK